MIWVNSTTNKEVIVEVVGEEDQEVEEEEGQVELEEEDLAHLKYLFSPTDCLEYLLLEDNKIP